MKSFSKYSMKSAGWQCGPFRLTQKRIGKRNGSGLNGPDPSQGILGDEVAVGEYGDVEGPKSTGATWTKVSKWLKTATKSLRLIFFICI